jgi:hypothetical protein
VSKHIQALEAWQTLPTTELFIWKAHARKRASRIGGHVVKQACPVTGKWAVVETAEIAKQCAIVFATLRAAQAG